MWNLGQKDKIIIVILFFLAVFSYQMHNISNPDKESQYEQTIEAMNNGISNNQKQIVISNKYTKRDFYGNNMFEEVLANNNYKKVAFDKENTIFELQD